MADTDDVETVTAQLADGRHLVPGHLWGGILAHVIEGRGTGTFLSHLFSNDLLNAVCGADEDSLAGIRDLMLFMHNHAPARCWGSADAVKRWRQAGGIRGGAHLASAEVAHGYQPIGADVPQEDRRGERVLTLVFHNREAVHAFERALKQTASFFPIDNRGCI